MDTPQAILVSRSVERLLRDPDDWRRREQLRKVAEVHAPRLQARLAATVDLHHRQRLAAGIFGCSRLGFVPGDLVQIDGPSGRITILWPGPSTP